jgi:hypothetical protein
MEVVSLWEKISWWANFSKNWLKKKVRLAPWVEEGDRTFWPKLEVVVCN